MPTSKTTKMGKPLTPTPNLTGAATTTGSPGLDKKQGQSGNRIVQKEPSNSMNFNDVCGIGIGIGSSLGPSEGLMSAASAEGEELPPAVDSKHKTELGYLNEVSEVVFKQCRIVAETTRREEPNMYSIEEKGTGEKLYKVYEDTTLCMQQSCGANRSFKLRLMDKFDRELILVERPYVSCDYCCGLTNCCDIVNVWVKNYKSTQFEWRRFGSVKQLWCPLMPYFSVRNAVGEPELTVRGPLVRFGCFTSTALSIKRGSEVVGKITKEWTGLTGLCRDRTTDVDIFSMKFPDGIDEKLKVTLIGALLLIDFKFYEPCFRPCCG